MMERSGGTSQSEPREVRDHRAVVEKVVRMVERSGDPGMDGRGRRPDDRDPDDRDPDLGFMFDASPQVIARLRHHCHLLGGAPAEDYGSDSEDAVAWLKHKLKRLVKLGGRDILVEESPALGGFGFRFEGGTYNLDTMKFYEVLIAMRRGGILNDLMATRTRRAVWEFGGGWGGFAYQFKTLCPNTTYGIVDSPERFLFSAVYLQSVFPTATLGFCCDAESVDTLSSGWREVDFLFIPSALAHELRPVQLDLAVDVVTFERLDSDRIESSVRRVHELGCPFVYSLNRRASPAGDRPSRVGEIIRKRYWPHEIPVLPVSFDETLEEVPRGKSRRARLERERAAPPEYQHVIGWRRLDP